MIVAEAVNIQYQTNEKAREIENNKKMIARTWGHISERINKTNEIIGQVQNDINRQNEYIENRINEMQKKKLT